MRRAVVASTLVPRPPLPTVDRGVSTADPAGPGQRAGRAAEAPSRAVRGVAATTAASTGGPPGRRRAASTAAASVRVAPLVTTSSTRTSSAPGGGRRRGSSDERAGQVGPPLRRRQPGGVPHPAAPAQQPRLRGRHPGRPQLGHRAAGSAPARGPGRGCAAPRGELGTGTSSTGRRRLRDARRRPRPRPAPAPPPAGRASSARPRSLNAITAGRTGPA